VIEHLEEEPVLTTEVVVDLADGHAGPLGHGPRRQLGVAGVHETRDGRVEQLGTDLLGVRAGAGCHVSASSVGGDRDRSVERPK
jgi:hypothetical protein